MVLAGHGFELVGVSIFGPEPLDAVHLNLDEGLSVLYGLNGSGKTTVLSEVEAVLAGIGPNHPYGVSSTRSCLHIRLTSLEADPGQFEPSSFELALMDSILDPMGADSPPRPTRFEKWQEVLNDFLCEEKESDWIWDDPLLAKQQNVHFALVPIGTPNKPAWGSYLSAELSKTEWSALKRVVDVQRDFFTSVLENQDASGIKAVQAAVQECSISGQWETPWTKVASKGAVERDLVSGWPAHFALPISLLGRIEVAPVHVISDRGTMEGVQEASNNLLVSLAESEGELIDIATESETQLNPRFLLAVSEVTSAANTFLDLTGPHYFTLELELKSPSEWFVGEVPEWWAKSGDIEVGLGRLSGAELRWAKTALQWAITGQDTSRPQIFLIDEPERGLHRARERELPRAMNSLCRASQNLSVLAASHAPAFLDVRVGAILHHVSRLREYPTVLHSVDLSSQASLSQSAHSLGLAPSDLLQLTRVFVLVEGIHDEIVLDTLIGDSIRDGGGRIIPINGAAHARSIADARILFDATEASVVFVLDNVVGREASEIWESAVGAYENGQRKVAKSILARLTDLSFGGESLWLRELGERAIDCNVIHRIRPFGLSKRDILCYLPVTDFVSGARRWEDLETEYDRARRDGRTKMAFKSWLTTMRGADFSRANIEKAAKSMPRPLPREFTELALLSQSFGLLGPLDLLDGAVHGDRGWGKDRSS
ncbi:hypothetical protein ACWF5H_11470 [Arthrobacter sp. NPDC055138]